LKLSINLVNGASCLRGPLVSAQDAKRDTKSFDEQGKHPIEGSTIDDGRVIECGPVIGKAIGVWDLSMLGSEQTDIENRYHALTDGPTVESRCRWWSGPILCRDDGVHCEIVTQCKENQVKEEPYNSRTNYRSAKSLPDDSVFGLSPSHHPTMGRVAVVYEPIRLGGATGRGAEPSA